MDDERAERELLTVMDFYEMPTPRYGEHPMRCPAHHDKVASASVNRRKGVWHCHACGAGGGAAAIVMAREGVDLNGALAFISGLTGEAPVTAPRQRTKRTSKRWIPPKARKSA